MPSSCGPTLAPLPPSWWQIAQCFSKTGGPWAGSALAEPKSRCRRARKRSLSFWSAGGRPFSSAAMRSVTCGQARALEADGDAVAPGAAGPTPCPRRSPARAPRPLPAPHQRRGDRRLQPLGSASAGWPSSAALASGRSRFAQQMGRQLADRDRRRRVAEHLRDRGDDWPSGSIAVERPHRVRPGCVGEVAAARRPSSGQPCMSRNSKSRTDVDARA